MTSIALAGAKLNPSLYSHRRERPPRQSSRFSFFKPPESDLDWHLAHDPTPEKPFLIPFVPPTVHLEHACTPLVKPRVAGRFFSFRCASRHSRTTVVAASAASTRCDALLLLVRLDRFSSTLVTTCCALFPAHDFLSVFAPWCAA